MPLAVSPARRATDRLFLESSTALRLASLLRAPLLLLCIILAGLAGGDLTSALVGGVLAATAGAASLLPPYGRGGQAIRAVEAVVWAGAVTATGTVQSPYLAYLLAPALAGGLVQGVRAAVLVPGTAAAALLLLHLVLPAGPPLRNFSSVATEWVLLATAGGLVAAWARRLGPPPAAPDEGGQVQLAAHRLLLQLRLVARRLPGSLDPATTAQALLLDLRAHLPVEQAWVLVRSSSGDRLVPLASVGDQSLTWDVSLSTDSALSEAWASQRPVLRPGGHLLPDGSRSGGLGLALPLAVGPSVFGVVAVQSPAQSLLSTADVEDAAQRVQAAALALDTGLLFDELRASATTEERLRLSREIHDGIAQELASVGYALDALTADADGNPLQAGLVGLRAEVTRLVTELRLSLFDLRGSADLQAGLGAALGEHVRRVGASSGLTVHLTLSEGPLRLAPQAEAELFRIAQEAITNARKHSGGANLWVRCEIEPPNALLIVEDDGKGLAGPAPAGSYGLIGMAERAVRLKATLDVGERISGQGTRICVSLGTVSAARAS